VLIADDHAVVRAGLRALLGAEPSLELVGEASGGVEAVELALRLRPDILLLDMSMPDQDGLAVTRQVRAQVPAARILILTVHEDVGLLREAIKAGASGYVVKRAAEAELIAAIATVLRGDLYVDPALLPSLLGEEAPKAAAEQDTREPLTPRESEVLRLIAQGYTNRQIGEALTLSVRTVEGHRANLSAKLGMHSRVELVRYAREHGLIQ
jgi:two-component system response regulator NreC